MAIGDFGLLSKFISFAISHVKKYLLSNISRKHATTKLSFIFGKIRLNECEIRRFLFNLNNAVGPARIRARRPTDGGAASFCAARKRSPFG